MVDCPNLFITLDFILHSSILKVTYMDFHLFPSAEFDSKLWPSQPLQGLLCSYLCISIPSREVPWVSLHMQRARFEFFDTSAPFVGGVLFSIVCLAVVVGKSFV